jgi:uncharacterized membrane protein
MELDFNVIIGGVASIIVIIFLVWVFICHISPALLALP